MAYGWFVLPEATRTTDLGEERFPKYTDHEAVNGTNGGWIPKPNLTLFDSWPGSEVYVGRITADTQADLDTLEAQTDALSIGTDGEVAPGDVANYLNQKFRPQSWEEFKASREDLRDLSAGEWAEKLGGDSSELS